MSAQDYQDVFKTTSVYKTQCKTFKIAREITGNNAEVYALADHAKPPFCLRILKAHRTKETQDFRDKVAAQIKTNRG